VEQIEGKTPIIPSSTANANGDILKPASDDNDKVKVKGFNKKVVEEMMD